jgi:hypothetical protein
MILVAGSCQEGPTAGDLVVNLVSPNSDDGAVKFTLTGPPSAGITALTAACGNCRLFSARRGDAEYQGVIIGDLTAGALLRMTVADVKKAGNYVGRVDEVSSRTSELRTASAYSLTVSR